MKIHEEEQTVVGILITQGEEFDMLSLEPTRHNNWPWLVKEHAFEFYVIVDGFAQHVLVSRGNFMIIPDLIPAKKSVKFFVEDSSTENIKVDSLE